MEMSENEYQLKKILSEVKEDKIETNKTQQKNSNCIYVFDKITRIVFMLSFYQVKVLV